MLQKPLADFLPDKNKPFRPSPTIRFPIMPQTSSSHQQIEAPEFVFHLKYTYIYFRLKTEQIPYSQIKNCLPRNTISSTVQVSRSVQSLKSIRSHQSTPSSPHSIPTLEILGTKAYFLKETRIPYPLRIMMIQKRCIARKTHPPIFANPLFEPYSKVVPRIELRVSAGDILRISVKPNGAPIRHYYPILEGEELWITYGIWNTDKNPMVINEIQTSCGCIVADEGKRIIPPGHDERLMFRYDSSKN